MTEVLKIIDKIYSPQFDTLNFAENKMGLNPLNQTTSEFRPNSISFEGAGFGDEGKGLTALRAISEFYNKHKKAIVYRWNGGSNAGHECLLPSGKQIALHQLPIGILQEGVTSIVGKGMVFNPTDAITEIDYIINMVGSIPGNFMIDPNVPLSLDTHRAWENVINSWHLGYYGSTGRGISTSYSDEILRLKLTMSDLISAEWKGKLGYHYDIIKKQTGSFGFKLEDIKVATLKDPVKGVNVGTKKDFLDRIGECRKLLLKYVNKSLDDFLFSEWNNTTPFVFEGAQAIGLHPKHGLYPDVTSSEVRARGIQDSTEGIVDYKRIAAKVGVLKGPYISSVGSRTMPGEFDIRTEIQVRNVFGEYGKSTGRSRGILPPDIPALKHFRSVGDFEYLAVTHMDASFPSIPIVAGYKDSKNNAVRYRPYQWYLDFVYPEIVSLPGWDGNKAGKAKNARELPENALRFLAFITEVLNVKLVYASTGPNLQDYISWLP